MSWRIALACLVLAGVPRVASANGRAPATSSITFRQGQESDIGVGLTFGFVVSHDGGKTWAWMCEDAIGYKGIYDPRYAFSASGALFATTFNGLKVERDSCTFGATPAGKTFASTNALGPDHAFYYAAAQAGDAAHGINPDFHIYKSTDDGMTFPAADVGTPAAEVTWWQSLQVAPSNAQRLYLSGYAFVPDPGGGTMKQQLLLRSDNGGKAWTSLPTTAFTVAPNSVIDVVGIASDNPDLVYVRVALYDNTLSDAIWRSLDGGLTWGAQPINTKATSFGGFVVRAALNGQGKHDVIAGTQALGAEISHDDGTSWAPLAGAPHMNCLVENAAGELWACTQNYGVSGVPSDDAGIMKTKDLATWTKVLRYQDLTEAVTCAAGTVQKDTCATTWCAVCAQLGCTPSPPYGCPVNAEAPVPPPDKGGCCDSGSGGAGALALGLSVGMVLLRPRRRREH
jgi:hypothetical protein